MRLTILAVCVLLVLVLTAITKTGFLRPWALRMLDRPPQGPVTVRSEFVRALHADWVVFDSVFLPFRRGTVVQYEAVVQLVRADGGVPNPPPVRTHRRMWHEAGFSKEEDIGEGLEGTPYRDGRVYVEQAGRFSLNGVPGGDDRGSYVWPLLEVFWHEGERPSALRSYPTAARWTHALRGIEEGVLFVGPASAWWPRISTDPPEQGLAFLLRRWGTSDPYLSDALEGASHVSEWVVLGPEAWLSWHRIADGGGRTLVARGCGQWQGTSLGGEVEWNPPPRRGARTGPEAVFPRVVRLTSDAASVAYQVESAATTGFAAGAVAYVFSCRLIEERAGTDRCHGAGIRQTLSSP